MAVRCIADETATELCRVNAARPEGLRPRTVLVGAPQALQLLGGGVCTVAPRLGLRCPLRQLRDALRRLQRGQLRLKPRRALLRRLTCTMSPGSRL